MKTFETSDTGLGLWVGSIWGEMKGEMPDLVWLFFLSGAIFSLLYSTRIFLLAPVGAGVDRVTFLLSTYIACLVLKAKHTLTTETSQPPEWETDSGFWLPGYLFWLLFSVLNTDQDPLTQTEMGSESKGTMSLLKAQGL